jgi:hypothetical protein
MAEPSNDDSPAEAAAEPLMSLAEAAAATGRKPEAIRAMVRSGRLQARRGNDGKLLIAIPAHMRQPSGSQAEADLSRAASLEADVERWRAAAEEARLEAAKAAVEARLEAAVAAAENRLLREELSRERERNGRLEGELRELVERLERDLMEARRPWWARLVGRS